MNSEKIVAIAAAVIILLSVVAVWQIGSYRASQAHESKVSELVNDQVQSRQALEDYDGDSIADSKDRCPTRPESQNGFRDGDGCPDIVTTTTTGAS